MRYILITCKGDPPAERPVGMKEILRMGHYKSVDNAMRYMMPDKGALRRLRVYNGYTHLGLYESPEDYGAIDRLVKTINLGP